jgi:CrcB protein
VSGWTWIAIAVLGGVGAVARFLVDGAISSRLGRDLPVGTLVVNVTGSLALGVITSSLSGTALTLAGTATVGSYTTFSTWMLETHRLGEESERAGAAINVTVSLTLGLGAAALGRVLAHHV